MKKISLIVLITLCISIFIIGCSKEEINETNIQTLEVKSDELKSTAVSAHMEKEIKQGENILYCSTFQLAWNQLTDDIIKEEIKLFDNPETSQKLNKRLTGKKDLSDKYYLAMAGYGRDNIVEKINKALNEKFQDNAPTVKEEMSPRDILAYAFLYKNLEFQEEFEKLDMDFNGEKVQAFGINQNRQDTFKMAEQVKVLDYKNTEDFIIELVPKSQDDEIILAKISPEEDLLKTIEKVQNRINSSESTFLRPEEIIKIPKFDFDIKHDYKELIGQRLLNEEFSTYFIAKALQNTKFKLNEKGAVLESEAKILLKESCVEDMRSFIFNKPFLIILKEKEAQYPYFALWVDNSELMLKQEK
jgi:hypothetical protein